jgi:transposase, IS30 family
MAVFNDRMVPARVQPFWAARTRWLAACGGVRPRRGRDLKGRYLSFSEREEIALSRARGESVRLIARRVAKSPSTVSRELPCDLLRRVPDE